MDLGWNSCVGPTPPTRTLCSPKRTRRSAARRPQPRGAACFVASHLARGRASVSRCGAGAAPAAAPRRAHPGSLGRLISSIHERGLRLGGKPSSAAIEGGSWRLEAASGSAGGARHSSAPGIRSSIRMANDPPRSRTRAV